MKYTNIRVKKTTRIELAKLKIVPSESLENVIQRGSIALKKAKTKSLLPKEGAM